jgi:hypothetical protein
MRFLFLTNNLVVILVLLAASGSLGLLYSEGKVLEAKIGAIALLVAFCLILWGSRNGSRKNQKAKTHVSPKKEKNARSLDRNTGAAKSHGPEQNE